MTNAFPVIFFSLFFISGFTGLVYEVAWVRLFTRVFGNTTYSVTAVLAAYMAGLALGSLAFGKLVDRLKRPLYAYALLEAGVALSAAAVPFVIPLLDPVYAFLYRGLHFSDALLTVSRFILSFILVFVPTLLMGGTLPALARYFIRQEGTAGRMAGALYGSNTLGATLGCFITGFYLIRYFGVRESILMAAVLNAAIAAYVFISEKLVPEPSAVPEKSHRKKDAGDRTSHNVNPRLFLLLAACAGFVSLSCEVLWTRLLVFKLKTTVYAFTIMLTTFLLGIGLGSVLFSYLDRRLKIRDYLAMWGYLQWGTGISCFLSILSFGGLALLFPAASGTGATWTAHVLSANLLPSILVMAVPTLLAGMAFPAAAGVFTRQVSRAGESIGALYAAGTAGSILGSVATGFFLVTALGTQNTLAAVSLLACVAATAALFMASRSTGIAALLKALAPWPVIIIALLMLPREYLFRYYNIGESEHDSTAVIDYAREGIEGITTVHRFAGGTKVISAGSINVAGTAFTLRTTQKLQAHIPMLLHGKARLVCQVGFGSGETSRIITTYDIERLDLVEISRPVIDTAERFFSDINGGVTRHPRFNAVIMDGANYFRLTRENYDIIMNDSIWPYYAGNSGLYTREYFRAAKKRLRPGGIMTSWVPVSMDLDSLVILLKTFRAEFPRVSLWFATSHENQHALIVGSSGPIAVDPAAFAGRFERFARRDLKEIGYATPAQFLDICKFSEASIDAMESTGEFHTENDPCLEFAVSRTTMQDLTNTLRLIELRRERVEAVLFAAGFPAPAGLKREMDAMHRATARVLRGLVLHSMMNPAYAAEYRAALALVPDYPGLSMPRQDRMPGFAAAGEGGQAFRRHMERARRYMAAGRFGEAAVELGGAVRLEPGSGEAHTHLGEAYLKMGRFDEAEESLNTAIRLSPDRFDAYYHLGWIRLRRRDLKGAVSNFEKGISLNPGVAELHYVLGRAYALENRLGEAGECFRNAIRLSPFDPEFHFEAGMIHERRGRYSDAGRCYEKALELNPEHQPAQQRLRYVRSRPIN